MIKWAATKQLFLWVTFIVLTSTDNISKELLEKENETIASIRSWQNECKMFFRSKDRNKNNICVNRLDYLLYKFECISRKLKEIQKFKKRHDGYNTNDDLRKHEFGLVRQVEKLKTKEAKGWKSKPSKRSKATKRDRDLYLEY